jgi:hypothetical protein
MTTPPTHPDLLALLRGELSNAEVLDTADHLDQCESCRHDLTLTATGHALVTSSARTLGPLTRPDDEVVLPPVPDVARLRRQRRRAWVAKGLVAAVAAAVVWSGGYLVGGGADPDPVATPPPGPTRSVVLTPVEGSASGSVTMSDEGPATALMRIETDDLRPTRPGQFYYAWLLDPATNKMLPLGQVGPGGTASFEVSQALLSAYSAVDVSLEADDGDPGHSPRSVLRAVYA